MTRLCDKCGFENQDDYDYCAKCGNPLIDGLRPKQVYVYHQDEPQLNMKALAIAYAVSIFLSWGGFIVSLLFKTTKMAIFTFFGLFLPFYLMQSPVKRLKMHGFIMLFISILGVALSFYVMMH